MKKLIIMLVTFMLVISRIAEAETLTPDQALVKALIQRMYAIDREQFEAATFGAQYNKHRDKVVAGKYDPSRQCRLLGEFLVKEVVIKEKGVNQGCMTGVDGYFRYPGEDILGEGARETPLPKAKISTPEIQGDKARVYVTFIKSGDQNVFYYLKKLSEGWRIYKVESRVHEEDTDPDVFPPEKPHK